MTLPGCQSHFRFAALPRQSRDAPHPWPQAPASVSFKTLSSPHFLLFTLVAAGRELVLCCGTVSPGILGHCRGCLFAIIIGHHRSRQKFPRPFAKSRRSPPIPDLPTHRATRVKLRHHRSRRKSNELSKRTARWWRADRIWQSPRTREVTRHALRTPTRTSLPPSSEDFARNRHTIEDNQLSATTPRSDAKFLLRDSKGVSRTLQRQMRQYQRCYRLKRIDSKQVCYPGLGTGFGEMVAGLANFRSGGRRTERISRQTPISLPPTWQPKKKKKKKTAHETSGP